MDGPGDGSTRVAVAALNRLGSAIRHAILRDARLLWARIPETAADFAARTLKEYLALKPYLDRYDRDLFRQSAMTIDRELIAALGAT
ncbi:MAG: hypothetical protein DMF99_07840 [Acidobacteria bacterium]|nr:MAG: hypothetical protein DMF99_07840 [Acidobacteriota bacterium]